MWAKYGSSIKNICVCIWVQFHRKKSQFFQCILNWNCHIFQNNFKIQYARIFMTTTILKLFWNVWQPPFRIHSSDFFGEMPVKWWILMNENNILLESKMGINDCFVNMMSGLKFNYKKNDRNESTVIPEEIDFVLLLHFSLVSMHWKYGVNGSFELDTLKVLLKEVFFKSSIISIWW